jgi:hypothetical protein
MLEKNWLVCLLFAMSEPTTTISTLLEFVTQLITRVKDRQTAAELREILGMIAELQTRQSVLDDESFKLKAENAQLNQLVLSLQKRVADAEKKHTDTGEKIKFHKGVKFRKNVATGQKWMPFCPNCDQILQVAPPPFSHLGVYCSKPKCGFRSSFTSSDLEKVTAEIGD